MTTRTDMPSALTAADQRFLTELARQLRADSIRCSTAAGSGHPTSAMSAADLMAVLLARHLRYDWDSRVPDRRRCPRTAQRRKEGRNSR